MTKNIMYMVNSIGFNPRNEDWIYTETIISPEYSVTHPTGARVSIMVGFNLSK